MTRFAPDDAALDAARRVLAAHTHRPDRNLVEVELAGPLSPDPLVAFAEAHPDQRFVGRMLAATSEPERLLRLVPVGEPLGANVVATVAELAIRARDENLSNTAVERISASVISQLEGGRDSMHAGTFQALIAAFPELADGPLPSVVGSHNTVRDIRKFLPQRAQPQPAAPPPPPAQLTGSSLLAQVLTDAYGRLAVAKQRADETMQIAMKADEEKQAAQVAVEQAEAALKSAMGLSK